MECLGVTGELGESKQFEWKIANFLSLSAEKGKFYSSPSFVFDNTSFHLEIYPFDEMISSVGYLSVCLRNESDSPIRLSNTLHIKKPDGTLIEGGTQDVCIQPGRGVGYRNFCMRSCLEQNDPDFLPSGILTVICTLKCEKDGKQAASKEAKVENSHEEQAQKTENHKKLIELDVLSQNLIDLSFNKDSCDTVIQVEDKEIQVHKTILMARSSVFAAMFQHDTLERQTGCVKIPDCDAESFPEFIEYLYCGKLEDISFRSAFHLYSTSDKYNVQELKNFCVQYLIENMTEENVCDIIKLADQYDEEKLLSATQNFFIKNWNKIFVTSNWKNLMKNDYRLAYRLLTELSKTKDSQ